MTRNLKIGHIVVGKFSEESGGIDYYVLNLLKQDIKGLEQFLITMDDEKSISYIKKFIPDIKLITIGYSTNPFKNLFLYSKLKDFDILVFHEFGVTKYGLLIPLISLFKKQKMIYVCHVDHRIFLNSKFIRLLSTLFFKFYSDFFTRIIVASNFMKNTLINQFKVKKDKIVKISNLIEIEESNRRKKIKLKGNPSLLFVGHLSHIKGVDLLIKAISLIANATIHLHIIGKGDKEQEFKKLSKDLNIENKITFWGSVSHSKTFYFYKNADICVVPSRYDNFPNVILEAMVCSCPVITSSVGGTPEIIKDGENGLLISLDPKEIAKKIELLEKDKELIKKIKNNGLKSLANYDSSIISKKYRDLYEKICQNGKEY